MTTVFFIPNFETTNHYKQLHQYLYPVTMSLSGDVSNTHQESDPGTPHLSSTANSLKPSHTDTGEPSWMELAINLETIGMY